MKKSEIKLTKKQAHDNKAANVMVATSLDCARTILSTKKGWKFTEAETYDILNGCILAVLHDMEVEMHKSVLECVNDWSLSLIDYLKDVENIDLGGDDTIG